ncbi:MAG: PAS domain S-box protein [Chthoniobacter sp.]
MSAPAAEQILPKRTPRLRPLRVLIVEDNDDDTQLVLRELRRGGFEPDWICVESEAAYLRHLGPDLDIILADQTLPGFSAARALELLRTRGMEVPFIIVSGTIDEEEAVRAMRHGATDYLMKDRLARLGPAVDHAVEQGRSARERTQAEEALCSTHAQMRQLMEHSPAVIYTLRVEGDECLPCLISENVTTLLGFTVREAMRPGWWHEQLHADDRDRAEASIAETLTNGSSVTEYRLCHKDGSVHWVEDKRRLVRDSSERPNEIVGIWADITERKRADEVLASAFARERQARQVAAVRDITVGLMGAVILFVLAYWLKLFSSPLELLMQYRGTPVDEFFGTLFVLSPLAIYFAYRRWKDSEAIALERQQSGRDGRVIPPERLRALRARAAREAVGLVLLGLGMLVISDRLHLFATPIALLWQHQATAIDQVIGTVVVLMIAAVPATALFACRRWFDTQSEIGEEQRTTQALRTLLAGLDKRVQQSATDLARTNEALRIKMAEHRRDGDILRESERRFREMLQNVELIAITLDKDGTVTFCNDYLLKLTGWRREEVIGRNWFTQFIPGNPEVRDLFLENLERGAFPAHYENPIQTKGGELREIVWSNTMLRGSAGNFIGTASIGQDVTDRHRATLALQESEQRFRSFMQHSPIAGWVADEEGRLCYLSPGYHRMFGARVEGAAGKLIREIYPPEIAQEYLANNEIVFREQRVVDTVETGIRADGTPAELMVVKFPMSGPDGTPLLGGIALDITERKQLEQQFLRAQRMESIGTLAGGIAHDLNNSLGPILMALDVMKMKFPDPDSLELLDLISSSAQRGADMVKQVLSFGRGVEGRKMEVQVKHLLREIEKIANDTFLKNIQVKTRLPNDLRIVLGDPTQLHQVLLNLCLNARDAMPHGGTLSITAENLVLDSQYLALNPEAKPGNHVHIEVEDTGTGIPPEIIEKIFDPFFTTKEVGKGTGLGLYSALGIVKSHGGFIRVCSNAGEGTKFEIFLPAQNSNEAALANTETTLPRGNGEMVLVVDDEAIVREITRQTLETFGYRVLLATDGADGIGKIAAPGNDIAVVVTDIAMPVMDGAAMIQVLRRFNPRLPVIVTSGQATREQLALIGDLEVGRVLAKPFTAEDLLLKLKEAISSRS